MHLQGLVAALLAPLVLSGSPAKPAEAPSEPQHLVRVVEKDKRGWLGVGIRDMRPSLAREMNVSTKTGALVTEVVDESPAEKAGITKDDIIVEFNGKPIEEADDLMEAVRASQPGSPASVVVMRKGKKETMRVTLEKSRTPEAIMIPEPPSLPRYHVRAFVGGTSHGLQLLTLNRQLGEYFSAPGGRGVLVEEVGKRSAAKEAGFKAGDVILRIGKDDVEDVDDVWEALEDFEEGDTAQVDVLRKGTRLTLSLEIDEASDPQNFNMRWFQKHGDDAHHFRIDKNRLELQMKELQKQLQTKEFQKQGQMKELQEQLRGIGEKIRKEMNTLRTKLRNELRTITT
jgi:membrane-associated protease RseP (regulator of RpoE activity)